MKSKQIYSVYDYTRKGYAYYEAPLTTLPASGHFRRPRLIEGVVLPESVAVKVPQGARLVGHGDEARGLIATTLGGVNALGGLQIPKTSTLLWAGALGGIAWWLWKRGH